MRTDRLGTIAATLKAEGLRPIVDRDLELVRIDCPDCRAGEDDPAGIYRPASAIPRGKRTLVVCDVCGEAPSG